MEVKDTDRNLHEHPGNEWRMPCCGKKWVWGQQGRYRLFVIGGEPGSQKSQLGKYAFIGEQFDQNPGPVAYRIQCVRTLEC